MSLDLHIYAEMDVSIFLPRGHRGVLHRIQIDAIQICRRTNRTRDHVRIIVSVFGRAGLRPSDEFVTFNTDRHVGIDALAGILQPYFFNLNGEK